MEVLNIHRRVIQQPKASVAKLLETLATRDDRVWPYENWPMMKLDNGLNEGSKGGHGPVRYFVKNHIPGTSTEFEFLQPKNFKGTHKFELKVLTPEKTELRHTIKMKTSGTDTLLWIMAIRWLHDALVEDALDKVENYFDGQNRKTDWSLWVKLCRKGLKPSKK